MYHITHNLWTQVCYYPSDSFPNSFFYFCECVTKCDLNSSSTYNSQWFQFGPTIPGFLSCKPCINYLDVNNCWFCDKRSMGKKVDCNYCSMSNYHGYVTIIMPKEFRLSPFLYMYDSSESKIRNLDNNHVYCMDNHLEIIMYVYTPIMQVYFNF